MTAESWLDQFETLWQGGVAPPSLLEFFSELSDEAMRSAAVAELALIDLEQRWRHFYRQQPLHGAPDVAGLPPLPAWADYCALVPGCHSDWLDGICHEFRVRQAFGDRPHYRELVASYANMADQLRGRLPDVAAEITRATICVFAKDRPAYRCKLPGRLEIGRQRREEPAAPALLSEIPQRLLIADMFATHISRAQMRIEVVAKDRLSIQHLAEKGSVWCGIGQRLSKTDACELELPCVLDLHGYKLQIERL